MKHVNILKISDLIVSYFNELGGELSPMKLQKLLYYIQAWHLANFNHSLFVDEPEAWVNGPVYKKVYNKYRHLNRHQNILEDKEPIQQLVEDLHLKEKQNSLIFEVLEVYGKFSEFELVNKTHSELPWIQARKNLKPYESSNNDITHESMSNYYKSRF